MESEGSAGGGLRPEIRVCGGGGRLKDYLTGSSSSSSCNRFVMVNR